MTEDAVEPRREPPLVVLRCLDCGDTFPTHEPGGDAICPTCGGGRAEPAAEPLL